MEHVLVELKARCRDPEAVRRVLDAAPGARFVGVDRQRDVYFDVPAGRFKLRRGTIERALVFYRRPDAAADLRRSDVALARLETLDAAALDGLEATLRAALGVRTVVEKTREIRFVHNVKFHLDELPGRGTFVEIEAIGRDGDPGEAALRAQCEAWRARLGIGAEDLVAGSYSDSEPDPDAESDSDPEPEPRGAP